jgi:hypothetical protein
VIFVLDPNLRADHVVEEGPGVLRRRGHLRVDDATGLFQLGLVQAKYHGG